MKILLLFSLTIITSHAAISLQHHYTFDNNANLGEDSVGSADFTTITGVTQSSSAAISGNYAQMSGGVVASGADWSGTAGSNASYILETYVRLDSFTSNTDIFFTNDTASAPNYRVVFVAYDGDTASSTDAYWGASTSTRSWIGFNANTTNVANAQAQTVNGDGAWTHLALVHNHLADGSGDHYRYYVNGTYIGNLLVNLGDETAFGNASFGAAAFNGAFDEIRVSTWDPNTDTIGDVENAFSIVPEPSSAALLGISLVGLMFRRR
ncbi:MAG: PEP-CTERM sorting domain-containing protein [Akkermansiaceae bacterium]|nr:PEP-CTERM sorting domain-containing protein [Akkermansiaceae bacterium]